MRKIGFVHFSSCGGCLFSVLSNAVFPDLIKNSDIRLFEMVSDTQDIDQLDIIFVEGGVSSEDQIEFLERMSQQKTKIIALGTCAVSGGVMSQSKNISVQPVKQYAYVYASLPGCPPPQRLLGNLLLTAVEGIGFHLPEKNVCAECQYTLDQVYSCEIVRLQPERFPKRCLLQEGVLCLGPVTRAGCEAKCIQAGLPCDGCFGSVERNMPSAIVNLFSLMNVSPEIRRYAALAFRYEKPKLDGAQ